VMIPRRNGRIDGAETVVQFRELSLRHALSRFPDSSLLEQ